MMKKENFLDSYQHGDTKQRNITAAGDNHLRKMFLGGLQQKTNEEMIRQFFYQFGEIEEVVIMRDPATKRSRGFGFITFKSAESVNKAQAARPHTVDGRTIDSKRALPRNDAIKYDGSNSVRKIFVGGLKDYHDEECLREYFQQFGKVFSVNILVDKITGRKRGFAFVEFDDYDTVERVMLRKNHTIKYMLVDVKKSNYKQVQAKRLAMQQQVGSTALSANTTVVGSTPPGYIGGSFSIPPPQVPYGGWNFAQSAVPLTQITQSFGAYSAPTATPWNGYTAAIWPQQDVFTTPPPSNGWNTSPKTPKNYDEPPPTNNWSPTPPETNGTFGNYQHSYNAGPQKNNNLQGNRMNPYGL